MARSKEYDRDDVLEKAVGVFWRKGYKATSVTDIVEATGLNTASLYKEFGDKDGLFEESLEYYRKYIISPLFQCLIDEPNLGGIKQFIRGVVELAASNEYIGCLMMNSLAQESSISSGAFRKVNDFGAMVEGLLEAAFRNAQLSGDVSTKSDPKTLASYVILFVHGMVLYGRYPAKKRDIPKLYDQILKGIT